MKSGTLGFSFGCLVTVATDRAAGGRRITGLDVFEITAIPTPANADTRVLSTKALDDHGHIRAQWRDDMLALFAATEGKAATAERKNTAPIRIAEYRC